MTKAKLLDLIYDRVNELMRKGSLPDLDKMFVFSKETDMDLMIGLLTASLPVKSSLPARPAYYQAVSDRLKELGETDPTILRGLA
jgi:hypothetical protein